MKGKNVLILGAGTMGAGIAQVFAAKGYKVALFDVSEGILDQAMGKIEKGLSKQAAKGTITEQEREQAVRSINPSTSLDDLGDCFLAIEAVTENLDVKRQVFRKLDGLMAGNAIIASNTSSISITGLASVVSQPERVVGMHFMNPVPLMKLVEVVKGLHTSRETLDRTVSLAQELDKTPVVVSDSPGFVSNRVLMPMINEAVFCLYEGVAEPEAIDTVMKLGMNHPMGPLALADLIGLDVCLEILEVLHNDLGDQKYRPCPLLRKMVEAGNLGKKTGRGFYEY
ncbi:MAG: 3-hydroxyacyl-CoA dehydrogenase family protein [Candidatus Glassbacteria bacterium]